MKVPEHIKGNGPDRKLLPNYQKLGDVDDLGAGTFVKLRNTVERHLAHYEGRNDINDEASYEIAQNCPLKTYFPSSYRQLLLQHYRQPIDPSLSDEEKEACKQPATSEFDYKSYTVQPIYDSIGKVLYEFIPSHFRARIAVLPPGEVLDWHIDSNTSYACRIQIPVIGSCHWQIKRRKEVESRILNPGEVWFMNTGFSHRVENNGTEDRVVLLVGCKFDDIKDRFPEIVPQS